jgi:hypothetical protein
MPRKARPEITLKDFSWSRDPGGYRLWNDGGVQRVSRSGAPTEPYKPFEHHENLLGEFASMRQSPEGVLDFVRKFGPLTVEGMDTSKGEDIAGALQQVRLLSKVLRAAKHEHYPLVMPKEPKSVSLIIKIGDAGPEGLFLKLEPQTLLDAIWLHLAQVLSGDGEIRHCLHCGVWFVAGAQSGRRQDAKFCSDEHRVAFNNQRRTAGRN